MASSHPAYSCTKCTRVLPMPPAMTNATGSYCLECKQDIHSKIAATNRRRIEENPDCAWCGAPGPHSRNGRTAGYCTPCHDKQRWLLNCVRHGPAVAAYVAKTELREAPNREELARQREAYLRSAQSELTLAPAPPAPAPAPAPAVAVAVDRTQADRIEAMMAQLVKALGGVP